MTDVVCISPIDGSEVARRASASAAAIDVALTAARQAQKQWAKVPLATRMAKMTAFVDAMLAMNQEVVPEIAWQMGRPVKWGGEFRPFEERARHMIAIAPRRREDLKPLGADVLPDAGEMSWSRATGLAACRIGCRFLRDEARAKVVVDPFCGRGNVLAVANALGLDAIGVDLALKRCRAARALVVDP